ncbi:unnamed protein product [Caenorhabditis auriculariae]|uniref:Uncharacterized protein n=1 Tax=Caenorhabditis auriculariae TaxID=2777116 RepID=A0A8S1GTT0_9PELO|nr:unnamed protein product [Caenorhabditis auriculariae]
MELLMWCRMEAGEDEENSKKSSRTEKQNEAARPAGRQAQIATLMYWRRINGSLGSVPKKKKMTAGDLSSFAKTRVRGGRTAKRIFG